jgi:hypothetical protein
MLRFSKFDTWFAAVGRLHEICQQSPARHLWQMRLTTKTKIMCLAGVVISIFTLTSCKEYKPQPECRQTLKIIEHHGQRVLESINGIFLREDFPFDQCISHPYSEDPHKKYYVKSGLVQLYWRDGILYDGPQYAAVKKSGKWPEPPPNSMISPRAIIELSIGFAEMDAPKSPPFPDWKYSPAIPHKLYPIDLLPNFGLDKPDPQAGIGPISPTSFAYWAVRGTKQPDTKQPYTTFCSIRPPPNSLENDVTYQRDVKWLIQGETYLKESIGNTCRGHVSADNGKRMGAMIDVPGMAVKDIDKIYQAASKYLSDLTVE